jgi:hypothetical protein
MHITAWRATAALRGRRRAGRDDYRHLTANQIGRQRWQAIVSALRPAVFDRDILVFDIAALSQALLECGYERCKGFG